MVTAQAAGAYLAVVGGRDLLPAGKDLIVYPNPVRYQAWVAYRIIAEGPAELLVYALSGNLAMRIPLGNQSVGQHQAPIDMRRLASGIYWVVVRSASEQGVHSAVFKAVVLH